MPPTIQHRHTVLVPIRCEDSEGGPESEKLTFRYQSAHRGNQENGKSRTKEGQWPASYGVHSGKRRGGRGVGLLTG